VLPGRPFFQLSCVSVDLHVCGWGGLSVLITRSVPVLLSRQALMVPSELGMAATAAPLAAISSARSATTIAGVGLGILPNPPSIALIAAHYSFHKGGTRQPAVLYNATTVARADEFPMNFVPFSALLLANFRESF
jgi:hypothetical protein